MTDKQKEVLRNIIYAVESGGHVYGDNKYDCFIGAYTATDKEHAITIGTGQWMGVEAKTLLTKIRKADPALFKKLDIAGIGNDLDTKDWSTYNVAVNSSKATCIKKIISSTVGKKCQDELIIEQMEKYMAAAEKLGVVSLRAQAMCANFTHQGGSKATERVLGKTKKPYTLDNIYAACCTDTGNQVGTYKDRQKFVYENLKSRFPEDETSNPVKEEKHMISNCGHDENNKYRGGKAGDQTGGEWAIIGWYNRPWNVVLRHPDSKVQNKIASMARAAALNNLVGYDQDQRTTFWYHLKASNYDPAQITIACEADCSSGVAAIVKATGCVLGDDEMAAISIDCWTGNLKAALKACGFTALTASKYLTSADYLLPGDILLCEQHHVAINLDKGSKAVSSSNTSSNSNSSSNGDLNTTVKWNGTTTKAVTPRSWAGEEYSALKSVTSIPKGSTVGVLDTVKDNKKADWYFVLINNKVRGFIPASAVKKSETVSSSDGSLNRTPKWTGEVTASILEVRTWAGTEYPNIKSWPQLSKGNRVDVCDSVKDTKGAAWYFVRIAGKYYGFVHSAYIKKV